MNTGGITFSHVLAFELKCMMANQYDTLTAAIKQQDKNQVLVACLRLGWNDAFKHVSKNTSGIKNSQKNALIIDICGDLVEYFEQYARKATTDERLTYMTDLTTDEDFRKLIGKIKAVDDKDKPLSVGHIQKMFNIAQKLLLSLILTSEHAKECGLTVTLGEGATLPATVLDPSSYDYAFESADCPIDSIIINKLVTENACYASDLGPVPLTPFTWSQLGRDSSNPVENYKNAQSAIACIQSDAKKSNLCFDFENWNSTQSNSKEKNTNK